MMIEQLISIAAAIVVFLFAVLRLNLLKASRKTFTVWGGVEVLGLAVLMSGCAGVVGEWFLPNAEFHAETIVIAGLALFAIGISRGALCQVGARLQGWDGVDRRSSSGCGPALQASEFLERRFQRRS